MKTNKVVYYLKKLLIFLVSILALSILVFFIDLIDGNLLISPRKCL